VILGLSLTQLVVIGVMLVLIAALVWMWAAGDREGEMVDDDPTLDVQSHIGDSRPMRR